MKTLGLIILLFITQTSWADERLLRVEVIVFEQLRNNVTESFNQHATELADASRYAKATASKKSLYYEYNKLKKSSLFQPLYYKSWQLVVNSGTISLPIKIESPVLKGWVKLQRGYLLNVISHLEFDAQDGFIYTLKEKRRVLFDETHYLDHPKFGAIVKVSPL